MTTTLYPKKNPKSSKTVDQEAKFSEYWRERTVFPGAVPKEVKYLIKNISDLDKSFFRKLIKVSLGYIQETLSHENCELAFENLCKAKQCANENDVIKLSSLYAGVLSLLRAVLKINLKTVGEDTLLQDLKELGLPEEFCADLCKVALGPAHTDIINEVIAHNPHLPKLEAFDWSVDVTLSNNWSSKVLEPSVNMTMRTTDGHIHSFEVPIASFHLLRHSTATVLRHIEALERRK